MVDTLVDKFSPLPQAECDIIRSGIVVNHQMTCLYCAPQTKINYCFTKLNSAIEWLLSWVNHSSCPTSPSSVISLRRVAFGFSIAALQAFVAQCSGAWKNQMNTWYDLKQGSFHSCYQPKERINRHSFIGVRSVALGNWNTALSSLMNGERAWIQPTKVLKTCTPHTMVHQRHWS